MVPTASIETGLAASSAVGPSACAGAMGEAIEAMIHDCTPNSQQKTVRDVLARALSYILALRLS